MADALRGEGISAPPSEGLCLWIPVRSEQFALVTLAAHGVAVLPGSKCSLSQPNHIRVGTSTLTERQVSLQGPSRLRRNQAGSGSPGTLRTDPSGTD